MKTALYCETGTTIFYDHLRHLVYDVKDIILNNFKIRICKYPYQFNIYVVFLNKYINFIKFDDESFLFNLLNTKIINRLDVLCLVLEKHPYIDVNVHSIFNRTLFHKSIRDLPKNKKIFDLLLEIKDLNINAKDNYQNDALTFAFFKKDEYKINKLLSDTRINLDYSNYPHNVMIKELKFSDNIKNKILY